MIQIMTSFDIVQGGVWHFRTKRKEAFCGHSELWGPLGLLRMSYDLSGELTRWRAVTGYSTLYLSKGVCKVGNSQEWRFYTNIQTRIIFRLCKEQCIRYSTLTGIFKGQCVWRGMNECIRNKEKASPLERKDLCM